MTGDRILPTAPEGLVYANVGHFFAERGFVTIIPDYHLLCHEAKFPSGGEDVAAALSWAKERYGGEGPRDLFMLGNSSGGVHVATFMLSQLFRDARLSIGSHSGQESGLKWKGAVLLAPPYHYHGLSEDQQDKPREYYEDKIEERCVLGLLKSYLFEELEGNLPPVLAAWSTLDPDDEIVDSNREFVKEWREKGMPGLETMFFEGHNHISPTWSLGTKDQECEAWAEQVVEWMLQKRSQLSRHQ